MFLSLAACPVRATLHASPAGEARPARTGTSALALGAGAATLAAAMALLPARPAAPTLSPAIQQSATLSMEDGASLVVLRDAAEDLRARVLAVPGVGAVSLHGLQSSGVEVQYTASHLARFGVSPADLRAALPVQAANSAPGHLAVRIDAAQNGVQPIADMPVRAGQRVLRLGDVAAVVRTPLAAPVATLSRNGRPAVELVVTPATGVSRAALDRRVAGVLTTSPLPAGIVLN